MVFKTYHYNIKMQIFRFYVLESGPGRQENRSAYQKGRGLGERVNLEQDVSKIFQKMEKIMKRGVFIAILGINNLGKTTQAKMLARRLTENGHKALYQKYAVYDLEPTGPLLNDYLRGGNPHNLSPETFQTLQAMNKVQFQSMLLGNLSEGVSVIAEDYAPTSIAWGVGAGVSKEYLVRLNQALLVPDCTIVMDGERFVSGIEKSHKHESNDTLTNRVREVHLELAKEHNWPVVKASGTPEEVHERIWQKVAPYLPFV